MTFKSLKDSSNKSRHKISQLSLTHRHCVDDGDGDKHDSGNNNQGHDSRGDSDDNYGSDNDNHDSDESIEMF